MFLASACPQARHTLLQSLGRRIALAIATLLLLGAWQADRASAALCVSSPFTPLPLTGSCFEGADGNQVDPDGNGEITDWQTYSGGSGVVMPDATGITDDVFKNGSKEEDPAGWDFVSQGALPKGDVLAAATYPDQTSGDLYLYLAFTRVGTTGSVDMSFELNQLSPTKADGTPTYRAASDGTALPARSEGDLLLSYDYNGGVLVIGACKWSGTASSGHWNLLDGTPLASTNDKECTPLDSTRAQGAINTAPIPAAENFLTGTDLAANQFGEASVDINKALTATGNVDPCFSFGSIWLHSRSSNQVNSDPKDLVLPKPIVVASCAVQGYKFHDHDADGVRDAGDEGLSGWRIYVDYNGNGVRDTDPVLGPEPYADTDANGHYLIGDIAPSPPLVGWTVREEQKSGWTCSLCSHVVQVTGGIVPGDQNFGNYRQGRLVVAKQSDPSGSDSFGFTAASPVGSFSVEAGSEHGVDVAPGTYSVTESADSHSPAYRLTDVSCDDGQSSDPSVASLADRRAAFHVESGETVKCTFTNTRDARLTIRKAVESSSHPNEEFSFTGDLATGADPLGDGESKSIDVADFSAGKTYSAAETQKSGWDLRALSCDGNHGDDDVTIDRAAGSVSFDPVPGEQTTCTFTNAEQGRLVVAKQSDPSGSDSFGFTAASPVGSFSVPAGSEHGVDVAAGTYTVTESADSHSPAYRLTDVSCDDSASDDPSVPSLADRRAAFHVEAGETVKCTFTNTRDARLTIVKQVVSTSHPNEQFSFTGDLATGADPLADGESKSIDVSDFSAGRTYSAAEAQKSGWDLTGLTCDGNHGDDDVTVDAAAGSVSFDPVPGEQTTCTFTNTERGRLVVAKQSDPSGSDSFDFSAASPVGDFSLQAGSEHGADVAAGTYAVTESADGHDLAYRLTDVSCDDAGSDDPSVASLADRRAAFHVEPGETVRCTFTNTRDARLTIVKEVDSGSRPGERFSFTGDLATGDSPLGDGESKSIDVSDFSAGRTYSATEVQKDGWDLSALACDGDHGDDHVAIDRDGATVTFDPVPGERTTCTFTNTDRARVTVSKTEGGDAPTRAWTFHLTGGPDAVDVTHLADSDHPTVEFGQLKPGSYTLCEVGLPAGWRSSLQDDPYDAVPDPQSGDVCVPLRLSSGEAREVSIDNSHPGITVDKTVSRSAEGPFADSNRAVEGDTLHYRLAVTNSGNVPLAIGASDVADENCGGVAIDESDRRHGDGADSSPGSFDPGDTWTYTCAHELTQADVDAGSYDNTVVATGHPARGEDVSDGDTATTTIVHPRIAIDKTGPASAQAGAAITYTLVVTNPGDEPFAAAQVAVSDPRCEAPPGLVSKHRGSGVDPTPGTLDPGDSWTYSCVARTQVGETVVHNVGHVSATDELGKQVEDSDPADTVLTRPKLVVEPADIASGTARLLGPSGCVKRSFYARVRGRSIKRVTFYLDGKKHRTVTRKTHGSYRVRINPRRLSYGVHHVTARVVFTKASQTATRKLRFAFQRCPRQEIKPEFTG